MRLSRAIAVVVALASLPHLPTIVRGYFQGDDFAFVRLFYSMPARDILKLFVSDVTQGIWKAPYYELRPLLALSYKLDILLWDLSPAGFHATNVALHTVNSVLVFLISLRVLGAETAKALLAAALFALAPASAEPIAWINGRGDLLPALFVFAAFLAFAWFVDSGRKTHLICSVALFGVGLFAKESVMVFPLMAGAYLLWRRQPKYAAVMPFIAVLMAYVALRLAVFGSAFKDSEAPPPGLLDILQRQPRYLAAYLPPFGLVKSWLGVMLSGSAAIALVATGLRPAAAGQARGLSLPAFWYVIAILPTLGATYFSYRHLYMATAGVALALASVLRPARTLMICLLLSYGAGQWAWETRWRQAGERSRKIHEGIERLTSDLPPPSVVILSRAGSFPVFEWNWALPYALQPPFSDIYRRHHFLEHPDLYCCTSWWTDKRALVEKELLGGISRIYLLRWDGDRRQLARAVISRGRIEEAFARVTGRPCCSPPLSGEETVRLMAVLESLRE